MNSGTFNETENSYQLNATDLISNTSYNIRTKKIFTNFDAYSFGFSVTKSFISLMMFNAKTIEGAVKVSPTSKLMFINTQENYYHPTNLSSRLKRSKLLET